MKRSIKQWTALGPVQQAALTEPQRVDALYDAVQDIRELHAKMLEVRTRLTMAINRSTAEQLGLLDRFFDT